MIVETGFEQGDTLWHEARMKSIGGTGISKIITTKGERSKSRGDYLLEKASQRLTGKTKPIFQTYEMAWGHKYEPKSREHFELVHGIELSQCAMIFSDDKKNWHISPDGFFLDGKIGFETKCPQLKEFKKTVDGGKLPTKHILQVQASLAITGWDKWYFQSYFPGLTPFTIAVERDEDLIKIIKVEVKMFLENLEELVNNLKS